MTEKHAETLPRALDGLVQDAMKYAEQAWDMADELAKAQADLATAQDRLKDAKAQIEMLEQQLLARRGDGRPAWAGPIASPAQLAQEGSIKLTIIPSRELLAGMAMQGMLSQPSGAGSAERVSEWSKSYANALIKALEGGAG